MAVCAGCGDPIAERTLLSALDRFWHSSCLNCSYCGLRLDELGSSVFVRSNMLLCRHDYLRLFGLTGTCAKCRLKIAPDEMVMRCQENVYHVNCFSCFNCQAPLHPGDKVCPINGSLFCEHEFPQLFANTKQKPDPDTKAGTEIIRAPNGSLEMNSNGCTYSLLSNPTQSDLASVLNFQINSPCLSAIPEHSPTLVNGLSHTLDPSESGSNLTHLPLTKPIAQPVEANPTTGRKKQKKVDSRRCPTLRVC